MKIVNICMIVCMLALLAGCGARHVSTLSDPSQKQAWVGDQDAILADIYQLSTPYGTVIPINQHASKGYIVQSRPFPYGFKTYTMVITLLPTAGKNEAGESVRAYGINIVCEKCDGISIGTEGELLQKITGMLNAKYQRASF